ncbi:hypothetical protein OF385_08890 [Glutamicibacter sp. JL.03c]|uniref:hypothetical protein n=1 Tax=Glutamicibacter sp. JL.03c TaxID=2984842 RepID=UPI0021F70497|nr:hypothetical protein [Glutamicibacter sp. JL.03c]UYQ76180.1 hypothetical protein OF385_08890 [Glutamicibacter sp. JL.03c]
MSEQVAQSVSGHLRIEERLDAVTGSGWLSSLVPTEEIATKAYETIENSALRVVQSENFASLWQTALRASHQSTHRIFTGQSSASLDQAGNLSFRLDDVVAEISKSLTGLGIPDLPATGNLEWNMKLIQNDALPTVQKAYLLVDRIGPWALYLNAAVLIAGVLLAPRLLSRALLWVSIVSALSFIALKTLIPDYVQERMLSNIDREVAREIFAQMSSGLATSLIVTAVAAGLLGAASIPLSRKWALNQPRSTDQASIV